MLKKTFSQAKNTAEADRRQSFRVTPSPSLIKEFAVWFMPPSGERTLTLEELGSPTLFSVNGSDALRMENVSAVGMRFSMQRKDLPPTNLLRAGHCYVYLKLRSPLPGKCALCSLFVGLTLLGASESEGRVHLRGKITSRGMAASSSKSFLLFNVERVGIKELTVWCEEISRMGRGILPPVSPGLDLEYLLIEISMMQQQMEDTTTQALPNTHIAHAEPAA